MKVKHLPFTRKQLAAAVLSAFTLAPSVQAAKLNFDENSELSGAIDITLGYAASMRATDADKQAIFANLNREIGPIAVPNMASEAAAMEAGDLISNIGKVTAELGLDWQNLGFVGAVTYQYDSEIMDQDNGQVALVTEYWNTLDPVSQMLVDPSLGLYGMGNNWTNAAEQRQGNAFDVLDAYFYGTFDIGENPLEVRLGKQVINWGEGLFYLEGVAQQVPLNISKLVTPGSELKEAYIGVESLYVNLGLGESSSLEAYYHFKFRRNEWTLHGSFYGDDVLFRGSHEAWNNANNANAVAGGVPGLRGDDIDPDDGGQFGVAFRTMVGDDLELGFYYSRYHDNNPLLSFTTNQDPTFTAQVSQGVVLEGAVNPLLGIEGTPLTDALYGALLTQGPDSAEFGGAAMDLMGYVADLGIVNGAGMSVHQLWAEDLDMLGASFATTLGVWSVNGEIAYRPDRPVYTDFFNQDGSCEVGCLFTDNGDAFEEHDSTHASVHGIWLGGALPGGITSQVLLVQVGADFLSGDITDVLAHNSVNKGPAFADSVAYGVAVEWIGTWQGITPGTDLALDLFFQKDIKGNSHFFGNFEEYNDV